MFRFPFLFFLLVGFALWYLEGSMGIVSDEDLTVVVSRAQVEKIKGEWSKKYRQQPTSAELQSLINMYVEDELLVRQAVGLGIAAADPVVRMRLYKNLQFLDGNAGQENEAEGASEAAIQQAVEMGMQDKDPVVRRRLIQVMEERFRSGYKKPEATDTALITYMGDHKDRYMEPAKWSFDHLLFAQEKAGVPARERAETSLAVIDAVASLDSLNGLADNSLIPRTFENSTDKHVIRYLGERFITELEGLPLGRWSGPVQSAYGWHLVHVRGFHDGDLPALDKVKQRLVYDWQTDETEKALRQHKKRLREMHEIVLETAESSS